MLGILRHFQAFSYASAFSPSDGVPPSAPAQVTQAVSTSIGHTPMNLNRIFQHISQDPFARFLGIELLEFREGYSGVAASRSTACWYQ
jgi:hypothetical protein